MDGSALSLPDELQHAADQVWADLARPGTWWTGAERVAIAAEARGARSGAHPDSTPLREMAVEAARAISVNAGSISEQWIQGILGRGLKALALVELLGVVSRVAAIDTLYFGFSLDDRPFPDPLPGSPTLEQPAMVELDGGWLPTVGPASAPSSLSGVPSEQATMLDLHGALYLTIDQMVDFTIEGRGLSRAQMELVAARTSLLNDCPY